MDPPNRYSYPPYMGQAAVGLSGHNQFKAPGLQTMVPPMRDTPYVEPYAGIKSHAIKKIVLNSVNANADFEIKDRLHIPKGAENSDFTVQIGDDLQSISQNNVASISLSDITFPGGQYLIEEAWSHIDFSEGIVITEDFRLITLLFRNMFDGGDDLLLEAQMPLTTNEVVGFSLIDTKVFDITLASDNSASILAVQKLWDDGLRLEAFAPSPSGMLVLGKDSAKITPLPDKKSFRVKLLDGQTVTGTTSLMLGYLTTSALPSPQHFAIALSAMIENATPYRSCGYVKKSGGDVDPTFVVPNFSLIFSWNGVKDTFSYNYTSIDEKLPELSGPLYAYMGYREGTGPESENDQVTAFTKRQTFDGSGTFVEPGIYESPTAFQAVLDRALNGNWFGPMWAPPDTVIDPTTSLPTTFVLHFRDTEGALQTITVPAGRYTPEQLALAIQSQIAASALAIDIRVAVVGCGLEFKGLSFSADVPFTMEFGLVEDPSHPQELNLGYIGYLNTKYSGCTHYEPTERVTWYPLFVRGGNCESSVFYPTQTYRVLYDHPIRKFRIHPHAFSTLKSTFVNQDGNTIVLTTPIAHGAQPGQRVLLKQGSVERFGVVLAGVVDESLTMNVQYGGAPAAFSAGDVYVNFVSTSWNLNTDYSVYDCILRQSIGVDAAFYVMEKGIHAFNVKSHNGLFVFSTLTLVSPNCIQLFPFEYVFLVVTFNHKDGEGVTMGIQTKKFGERINGSVVHALARIPIGRFSPESHSDAFDRHYEIQNIGVSKISSIRIQILNPDLSYYRSHGKHISVGLLLNLIGERFLTTQ